MKVHITDTIMRNRKGLPLQIKPVRKTNILDNKSQKGKSKKVIPLKLKKGEIKAFRKDDRYNLLLW